MSPLARGYNDGSKIIAARPRRGMAQDARRGTARPRAQSAKGHQLRGALHRAGIHLDLPGHGPTGFCPPRDRLCAGPVAAGVEIPEALCREFPQSRRVSRGLHGYDRQTGVSRDQAEMAAHRRLLVSARRHPDRRVLADRQIAEGHVDSRSGRRALSRAGLKTFGLGNEVKAATKPNYSLREIPSGVWALGFVSMLMDISSEMIHALLPVYLVTVLGTSMVTVGFIEGIAEATASITKIFSGALSDWLGKRKLLAVLGYGLAAFTKPVFPLAPSVSWLIGARFVDRVGKGIRGAPRDALVADIAPAHLRGASFGLRQSLDTVGAFVGPAIAIGLMWLTTNNFQAVFWVAVIPAFLAVGLLFFAVHEPERPVGLRKVRSPFSRVELERLSLIYWWVVGIAVVFSIARFSEAFLILRA